MSHGCCGLIVKDPFIGLREARPPDQQSDDKVVTCGALGLGVGFAFGYKDDTFDPGDVEYHLVAGVGIQEGIMHRFYHRKF